jgi:hypothetical protein
VVFKWPWNFLAFAAAFITALEVGAYFVLSWHRFQVTADRLSFLIDAALCIPPLAVVLIVMCGIF